MNKINLKGPPGLKPDFDLLRKLEDVDLKGTGFDQMWQKYINQNSDIHIVNTKFQSHPSRLSVNSENNEKKKIEDDEEIFTRSVKSFDKKFLVNKFTCSPKQVNKENVESFQIGDHARNSKGAFFPMGLQQKRVQSDSKINALAMPKSVLKKRNSAPPKRVAKVVNSDEGRMQRRLSEFLRNKELLKKLFSYMEKCCGVIKEMRHILDHCLTSPDGTEDYYRRHKRAAEFSARFSRNYLYPLGRHLQEMDAGPSTEKPVMNWNKLVSSYQLILQGLQACANHFPTTVGNSSFLKLKSLLTNTLILCKHQVIHVSGPEVEQTEHEEYITVLQESCVILLEQLDRSTMCQPFESNLTSKSKFGSVSQYTVCGKPKARKKQAQKRYSMYNTTTNFRKDKQWIRAMAGLDKKINVKSKYKTAQFKHRPQPHEKPYNSLRTHQSRHETKSSVLKIPQHLVKETPRKTPLNEDHIKTMVEDHLDEKEEMNETHYVTREQSLRNVEELNQENVLSKLLDLLKTNLDNPTETDNATIKLTKTVEALQNCLNIKNKNELMRKFKEKNDDCPISQSVVIQKSCPFFDKSQKAFMQKFRKEPIITVTGKSNAKLICIRDDNSINSASESEKEQVRNEQICQLLKSKIPSVTSETQTDLNRLSVKITTEPISRDEIPKIKIHRLIRPRSLENMMDKDKAINIVRYKLSFNKFMKETDQYQRFSADQPWEIVQKLADQILEHVMLTVVQEVEENNKMLENMYNAEFEY